MPHAAEDRYEAIEAIGGTGGFDYGPYVAPGNPFTVGQLYNPVVEPSIAIVPPPIFPTVSVIEPGSLEDSATPGPEALPQVVVDPESNPTTTVYENVPGGIYETSRAPTDWDAVYDQYVILNAPEQNVGLFDAVDWGEIVGGVVGGIFDPFGAGAAAQAAFSPQTVVATPGLNAPVATSISPTGGAMQVTPGATCPSTGPKYLKYCVATGQFMPLRRRRRRRLLTSSDIKDLSALKSIVGGAALQGAVVQAVRR